MKKILVILLLTVTAVSNITIAQTPSTVTLVSRTVKLNGGARATFGGDFGAVSRVVIPIELPANTIEWYYSFSTGKSEENKKELQLAVQISGFVADYFALGSGTVVRGLGNSVLQKINVPPGAVSVNSYLLDYDNAGAFVNKKSFHYMEAMQNTTEGKQQITGITGGTAYLGLQNVSTMSAALITVEVVALVSQ